MLVKSSLMIKTENIPKSTIYKIIKRAESESGY